MNNHLYRRFKNSTAILLIICLTVGSIGAQTGQSSQSEKVDLEMMKKIREEGEKNSKVMDTLSWLTDVIGYRLTGSPNMKAANEWTRKTLEGWGLENAQVESWGEFGRGWSFDKVSLNVTSPIPFPVIAYPEAWTSGTNGPVTADIVFADIKTEADFAKYKGQLKGKIVMVSPERKIEAWFKAPGTRLNDEELLAMANDKDATGGSGNFTPEMRESFRKMMEFRTKLAAFVKEEAPLALIKSSRIGDGGTVFVQGGGSRNVKDKDNPALPSVVVASEHYNRIVRMIQKGSAVKAELSVSAKFHDEDLDGYNTIAEIPGTDKKDEIVMLGAHLDSWHGGTGATDNAAGSAVTMEAVRILKALGVKPRRTIRIALWTGEEQGLLGSRGYAAKHLGERQPLPPKKGEENAPSFMRQPGPLTTKADYDKFSVYFNLDNGTGKIRGVYMQGNDATRSIFRAWLEPFRDMGAATLTLENTGGTDHLAFDAIGLPGFQFIQDPVEYDTRTHHSNMDVYDRIQADDMKQASIIMAAFIYNAAMREDKFPRKPKPAPAQQAQNK